MYSVFMYSVMSAKNNFKYNGVLKCNCFGLGRALAFASTIMKIIIRSDVIARLDDLRYAWIKPYFRCLP